MTNTYTTDEMLEKIRNGEDEEHYIEWLEQNSYAVNRELASRGYFPELFINDEKLGVIESALKAHPELLPQIIDSSKHGHIFAVSEFLLDKEDITEDEMLSHINVLNNQLWSDAYDYGGYSDIDYRAEMRMKMVADEIELTALEKTMTREQLYASKNIAWAKGMTIREIINWMNNWEQAHPFTSVDEMNERDGWLDVYYIDSDMDA